MPPRKTRAAAAAQEEEDQQTANGTTTAAASSSSSSSSAAVPSSSTSRGGDSSVMEVGDMKDGRPSKRARRRGSDAASESAGEPAESAAMAAGIAAEAAVPPPSVDPSASAASAATAATGATGAPPPLATTSSPPAAPPPPLDADIPLPPPPEEEQGGMNPPPPASPPPPPPPSVPPLDQAGSMDVGNDSLEVQDAEYWEKLAKAESQKDEARVRDLYLDTINRSLLDFDFEKLCSVSLSNINVYACLVCGKYFQGRGKNSYAYFHSFLTVYTHNPPSIRVYRVLYTPPVRPSARHTSPTDRLALGIYRPFPDCPALCCCTLRCVWCSSSRDSRSARTRLRRFALN